MFTRGALEWFKKNAFARSTVTRRPVYSGMETRIERASVLERLAGLPDDAVEEVLDFIDYLRRRIADGGPDYYARSDPAALGSGGVVRESAEYEFRERQPDSGCEVCLDCEDCAGRDAAAPARGMEMRLRCSAGVSGGYRR